ncbi:MAG: hypothetical protein J6U74_04250 [Clostridia bacterium]|nr:hypothetical protein [Clostridia bacterium]
MFKFKKIDSISTTFLSPIERVVEFTPRGADNIAKVLTLSVDGKVLSSTPCDGYADVSGRADFTLIYLDYDGNPASTNYNADFSVRLEGDVSPEDKISAHIKVIEWSVLSKDTLTLSAVVQAGAMVTKTSALNILTDAENSYITTSKAVLPISVASTSYSFPVDEETTVGDVDKVLSLCTKCSLTHTKVKDKQVDMSIDTFATITYVEGGQIKTSTFLVSSEESVAVDDIALGDKVYVIPHVKSAKVVLAGVTGQNILRFEGEISTAIYGTRYIEQEVVDDLFMLTHHTTVERENVPLTALANTGFYKERIYGEADLPDCENGALVGVPAVTAFVAKAVYDEDLNVEGIVTTEIIYSTKGELHSVRAEVPYSINLIGDFTNKSVTRVSVIDVNVKIKNNTAEINLLLGFEIASYLDTSLSYISNVEIGEERPVNTSGLSMYVAKDGDTMWDVCKALTAAPEQILSQNPTLTFPLKQCDKVIYFRQLKG